MEVKDFSYEISLAAEKNINGKIFSTRAIFLAVGVTTGISSLLTNNFYGNPIYHASGLIFHLINRISDYYTSRKVFELFEDSRFKEYGFDKYFIEINPTLAEHSKKEFLNIKQKVLQTLFGIVSIILPPVGHGVASTTLLLYENNRTAYKIIKKELDIGDNVKKKVEEGLSEEQIKTYLEDLYTK